MKKFAFILILLFFSFFKGFGQNQNIKRTWHWYFGHHAGIDFSSGTAVPDTTGKMDVSEGCAVMSDSSGNLLFYTNGDTVWNKLHYPMANGSGLIGCNKNGYGTSSTEGALIVNQPDNDSIYYIFTTDCAENLGNFGIRYSILNMRLNSGLGDLKSRDNLLYAPSTEKLTASYHANGKDFWIITHDQSNRFLAYLLTSNGLDTTPVISSVGATHFPIGSFVGYLRTSHDGKKIVSAKAKPQSLQLFDFDNSSGKIKNPITLNSDTSVYGVCFSPDNSKLYSLGSTGMWQYDLCEQTAQAIINNKVNISNYPNYAAQLGPDGKIYTADNIFHLDYLGVIQSPDLKGVACNYNNLGFYLGGKEGLTGLPLFVENFTGSISNNCINNGNLSLDRDEDIQFFPNPSDGNVTIHSALLKSSTATLSIVDLFGNKIFSSEITGDSSCDFRFDNINSGIYIAIITSSKTKLYKPLIIVK